MFSFYHNNYACNYKTTIGELIARVYGAFENRINGVSFPVRC